MEIPKGNSKGDIEKRRGIIESGLAKYKGKSFKCPCLGGVPVIVSGKSIDEISAHASKHHDSTAAALRLPSLIKSARYHRMYIPKENGQRKKFGFIFLYELHCDTTRFGTVKLTVGVREDTHFLQYCVTMV